MSRPPIRMLTTGSVALSMAIIALGAALAAEAERPNLESLVGQPVDIAPSAYQYRADCPPDKNPPESWIGVMKYAGLPFDKVVDVNAPAVKKALCGLLWEEVRPVRRVELIWSGDPRRRPKPEDVVLTYFDAEVKDTIPTWWNGAVPRGRQTASVRRWQDVHLRRPR